MLGVLWQLVEEYGYFFDWLVVCVEDVFVVLKVIFELDGCIWVLIFGDES